MIYLHGVFVKARRARSIPLHLFCGVSLSLDLTISAFQLDSAIVCVDDIQKICVTGSSETRDDQLSKVVEVLKGLAVDLNVPVVATWSLVQDRPDWPSLSQLGDVSAITRASDLIVGVHRQKTNDSRAASGCYACVLKNRKGELTTLPIQWVPHINQFRDVGGVV